MSQPQALPHDVSQSGVRTLQEIEAEMRAAAQQSRLAAQRQQELRLQHQQELEFHQQQLQLQRLQQQQQFLQQQQQQQYQQVPIHQHTPPPRMHPTSQSPRFLDHQRQILLLQQQQEQQQQLRLKEIQEQLRMEEIERLLRAQQISQLNQGPNHHLQHRQPSRPTLADLQAAQLMHQRRQHSPGFADLPSQGAIPQPVTHVPQNIQLQQRLLSEMAQVDFMRDISGASLAEQEVLRAEAMRKIMEAERMEEKRRRKAAKIAHMVCYPLNLS
jgi:DNA topoisomerase 2-associated protein PAT1